MMNRKRPARWLLLLPILPYLASLVLPVNPRGDVWGFVPLVIGTVSLFTNPTFSLLSLPNPLLWLGVYLLDRGCIKSVLCVGTVAALVAMLPIMNPEECQGLIGSPGYLTWVASMHLLVASGYLAILFPRKLDPMQRELWATECEVATLRAEVRELREMIGPPKLTTWDWGREI